MLFIILPEVLKHYKTDGRSVWTVVPLAVHTLLLSVLLCFDPTGKKIYRYDVII